MQFSYPDGMITVNERDRTALLAEVTNRLLKGAGFALATINLDHLVKLRREPSFRVAYAAQDLIVADGNPIVWLSYIAGHPVALVPGADMVVPLAAVAAMTGRPVVLVGSSAEALAGAAVVLRTAVPGLLVALCEAPPMGFDPEGETALDILTRISALGPCLCMIALGAPKQERFAALGRRLAPEAGFASIGAGLDFLGGFQHRAPEWVRALALEWLWRMVSAPRRMIWRYLDCAAILPAEALAAWRLRR